jgi:hypothetical protein
MRGGCTVYPRLDRPENTEIATEASRMNAAISGGGIADAAADLAGVFGIVGAAHRDQLRGVGARRWHGPAEPVLCPKPPDFGFSGQGETGDWRSQNGNRGNYCSSAHKVGKMEVSVKGASE